MKLHDIIFFLLTSDMRTSLNTAENYNYNGVLALILFSIPIIKHWPKQLKGEMVDF